MREITARWSVSILVSARYFSLSFSTEGRKNFETTVDLLGCGPNDFCMKHMAELQTLRFSRNVFTKH